MTTPKKWTKAEALEKFVTERVMGDVPFGYDLMNSQCVYDHSVGGGCAIGCLLPPEVASTLQSTQSVHNITESGALDDYLEDSHSTFWTDLQLAHDHLAVFVHKTGRRPGVYAFSERANYESYVDYLRKAVYNA